MTAWGAASLIRTSPTIQSYETANPGADSGWAVSVGILARYRCALSVSGDPCGLSGRFLASGLCIQKFRSPRQGFRRPDRFWLPGILGVLEAKSASF